MLFIAHLFDVSNRAHFDHRAHHLVDGRTAGTYPYCDQMFLTLTASVCLPQWISPRIPHRCHAPGLYTSTAIRIEKHNMEFSIKFNKYLYFYLVWEMK